MEKVGFLKTQKRVFSETCRPDAVTNTEAREKERGSKQSMDDSLGSYDTCTTSSYGQRGRTWQRGLHVYVQPYRPQPTWGWRPFLFVPTSKASTASRLYTSDSKISIYIQVAIYLESRTGRIRLVSSSRDVWWGRLRPDHEPIRQQNKYTKKKKKTFFPYLFFWLLTQCERTAREALFLTKTETEKERRDSLLSI